MKRLHGKHTWGPIALLLMLLTGARAQTSVLYWCDSSDTTRVDLVVTQVGNRYLVNNVSGYTSATKNVYYFVDWDLLGTPNQPKGITNLELEAGQLHMIHTYEINKPYTVNDFWVDAGRSSVLANLWIGGAPPAQTNISPQISEMRESGSWFYFEKDKRLSHFSQRFPTFNLPTNKMFYVQKYNANDTTNGYKTHGVTKSAITLSVNFIVDVLGSDTNGTNANLNAYENAFAKSSYTPFVTDRAASVANQFDYIFMDQEWWSVDYPQPIMSRMAWFFTECKRLNPNVKAGDWWCGIPNQRTLFRPVVGNRPELDPMWVVPDYNPATAFTNGDATLLTRTYMTNGLTSSVAEAQTMIPVNAYVGSLWSHDYSNTRPDVGIFDFVVGNTIHETRVNKKMTPNLGKPHIWFCSDSLFAMSGEPFVPYRTRTTSPPGVFTFSEVIPAAPVACEAFGFFGLFEGDGTYLWDDKDGTNAENPNCIFKLAKYCQDYNDNRGQWTPDVPGTPIGSYTNSYPYRPNFVADYIALGAWKYSTIADIMFTGQKVDFQFSTNNGVSWYFPPTNGSTMCEITRDLRPIVVGGVTTNQIAIAVYYPYQSVTSSIHVIARYAGNDYGFDVVGKRVRVFRGGLLSPIVSPPVITHTPISIMETAPPWTITATATDDIQVASAVLWWNRNGGAWTSTTMTISAGDLVGDIAPGNATNLDQFQYRIEVQDDQGLAVTNGPHAFIYSLAPVPAYVHAGSSWRYLATNAGPALSWKNGGFDDSLWPTGTMPMGYGSDTDLVTVVPYGPQSASKYPTTYFRTTFTASNVASLLALNLFAREDDGLVAYLNGTEIQRVNMPGGTIAYTNMALGNASNSPRPWQVFSINPTNILDGQNTLAVEVHQSTTNSSDIYVDIQLQPTSVFNWAVPVTPALLRSVQTASPPWTVTAQTTNGSQVASMQVVWNRNGGAWSNVPMTGTGGTYSASIAPGAYEDGDQFGYQIQTLSLLGMGTTNGAYGFMYMIPKGTDLLSPESTWKYLATNSAPATNWNAGAFNDTAWPSGPAPFGYGTESDAVTTVSYGPQATNKYPSYYFRGTFTVTNLASITALKAYMRVDDGLVLYLNGSEAGRYNMNAGAVTHATLASASGINPPRPWVDLDINPSTLVTGLNTIAVEVHQASTGSSDLFFDLFLQPNNAMTVTHTALAAIQTSSAPWSVSARVNSFLPVTNVTLFWGSNYAAMTSVPMILTNGNFVAAINPSTVLNHEQFQYRIEATDTVGGSATNGPIGFMYSLESAPALVLSGSTWKYLAQASATDPAWHTLSFDDSLWPEGPAPLGLGTAEKLGTILDYGPDANNKYTTYYFRGGFTLGKASAIKSLQAYCRMDDGIVLYLNGNEFGRINMASGVVTHTTFASINATNPPRPWIAISFDKALLEDGTNYLAAEVHQGTLTSSDLDFDFYLAPSWQPAITHTPLPSFVTSPAPWQVAADVESYYPLTSVKLWWTTNSGGNWTNVILSGSGAYTGMIAPVTVADHDQFQYRLEAQDNTGQVTTNGPFGFIYVVTPAVTLVSPGSGWKYWATNVSPGVTWSTVGFIDSSWDVGSAAFGFGGNETYGTVLGYGPLATNKYPTYYFRRTFSLTGATALASLKTYFQVDDGLVIYINGTEAGRTNMPSGTMSYTNYASGSAVNPPRPWQTMTFNPALVATGQNTIAVEVHQSTPNSSDLCLDFFLYGTPTNSTDMDSDGMPDSWEQTYFGGSTNAAANADSDGDRVSNLGEYITGTDPTSSSSKPQLRILASSNAPAMLGIQTSSNRLYAVDYSTNIVPPAWSLLTNITGDGSYISFPTGTNATKKGWYYRFRARLP